MRSIATRGPPSTPAIDPCTYTSSGVFGAHAYAQVQESDHREAVGRGRRVLVLRPVARDERLQLCFLLLRRRAAAGGGGGGGCGCGVAGVMCSRTCPAAGHGARRAPRPRAPWSQAQQPAHQARRAHRTSRPHAARQQPGGQVAREPGGAGYLGSATLNCLASGSRTLHGHVRCKLRSAPASARRTPACPQRVAVGQDTVRVRAHAPTPMGRAAKGRQTNSAAAAAPATVAAAAGGRRVCYPGARVSPLCCRPRPA